MLKTAQKHQKHQSKNKDMQQQLLFEKRGLHLSASKNG